VQNLGKTELGSGNRRLTPQKNQSHHSNPATAVLTQHNSADHWDIGADTTLGLWHRP